MAPGQLDAMQSPEPCPAGDLIRWVFLGPRSLTAHKQHLGADAGSHIWLCSVC